MLQGTAEKNIHLWGRWLYLTMRTLSHFSTSPNSRWDELNNPSQTLQQAARPGLLKLSSYLSHNEQTSLNRYFLNS